MNVNNLIPTDDLTGCPFPFFGDLNKPKKIYKIYNDGGHFVATISTAHITSFRRIARKLANGDYKQGNKKVKVKSERSAKDILFDSLYFTAFKQGLKDNKLDKAMTDFIRAGMLKLYPDTDDLNEYIADKIKRKLNNLLHRKKRFRRKANLNNWNYFVTFTYDDSKFENGTVEERENCFKKKLRKCLSNLHTRRGWKYMGVFERAPETGRLHFHGLVYVPLGEMLGTLTEIQDYDTVNHRIQTRNQNSFFADNFGINDFCEVSTEEMKNGNRTEYILKYIGKTNERIFYSRGIPTEICKVIDGDDIITEMQDFGTKYILFDDVISWERDIMRFRFTKQMSLPDYLCNPSLLA